MLNGKVIDLSDCSPYRQTLETRVPPLAHATIGVLLLAVLSTIVWAAVTKATLVISGVGRVRPIDAPIKVFAPVGPTLDGRVTLVDVEEGDQVVAGQELFRLDTRQLDNRIAKLERSIQAAEDELQKLYHLDGLLQKQFESARAKAMAELKQVEAQLAREKKRLASLERETEAELNAAQDHFGRIAKLVEQRAVPETQLIDADTAVCQAREKLIQARLPADEETVDVFRRALTVVSRELAVHRAELDSRRTARQAEKDAAEKELESLKLEQQQSVVRAPAGGVIIGGNVKVGDILEPGKPVFEIARQEGFRFELAVPSGDVGHIQDGMHARIRFDAYDYQRYGTLEGTVCFVSPDSRLARGTASREPAPDYIVRIALSSDRLKRGGFAARIRLGMGGQAEIVTGRESLLAILLTRIRHTISLG